LHQKLSYGIFLDNSHKSLINFGASNNRFSSISADAGDLNYYFFHGNNVRDLLREYTWLTGRTPLPPLWGLGYQQCRYSYYPDDEVRMIARTFREKDIPADAIVLDIHYMDEYKIYTWDKERFPDPKGMIADLKDQGFRIVLMCDPGIKVEKGYDTYESGKKEDIFIKYPDGSYYTGEVWPGWCHFPDFTNPKAREWWKKQLPAYTEIGVDGYWNDMNEIATWGHKLPDNIEFNFDGKPRPFNLTRSAYSGIQRYAAVWTGDNVANDEHMLLGVRLVNSLGLTGVAYAGYDVGGFVGNASEHLFARWIQLGAFSPFFRGHSMVNSRDSEPWAFGEEVEAVSRNYIKLRYRLMLYIYSAFHEASVNGMPVSRSLAIDYTHDDTVYDPAFENQYLFGDSFLIAPITSDKNVIKVYFPAGNDWYDLFTDKRYAGGRMHFIECTINRLPVFVKSGAIIPVCSEVGDHSGNLGRTIEWHLYNGKKDSTFTLYEDDGESYDHESGVYAQREVNWLAEEKQFTIDKQHGSFTTRFKKYTLCLHGFDEPKVNVDGKSVKVKTKDYAFVKPVPSFDPLNKELDHSLSIPELSFIEIPNRKSSIEIKIT
ncbi:MAG: glycoside hydrolase family 31 protein, partial [Cyclobacteriaceae bacterium]